MSQLPSDWHKTQNDLLLDVDQWETRVQDETTKAVNVYILAAGLCLTWTNVLGSMITPSTTTKLVATVSIIIFAGIILCSQNIAQFIWKKRHQKKVQVWAEQLKKAVANACWRDEDLKEIWEDPEKWRELDPSERQALAKDMENAPPATNALWEELCNINVPQRRLHRDFLHAHAQTEHEDMKNRLQRALCKQQNSPFSCASPKTSTQTQNSVVLSTLREQNQEEEHTNAAHMSASFAVFPKR